MAKMETKTFRINVTLFLEFDVDSNLWTESDNDSKLLFIKEKFEEECVILPIEHISLDNLEQI
jgi:hypothetical protein